MYSSILLATYFIALANSVPSDVHQLQKRATGYAPVTASCPSTPLVRPASNGIGSKEQAYFIARKPLADQALISWLSKVGFSASATKYPSVGLTVSGGGYRSMLEGGGVIQAFDSRDSKFGTSGLYQALSYHAGLSGGSWLLSSIAGNDWPTVSTLETELWSPGLNNGLALPGGANAATNDVTIGTDIAEKFAAGFEVTLTDPWGRLLSYQLLEGTDGGVGDTLSGITTLSSFTSKSVPYPIITSIQTFPDQCLPLNSNPQFELHPYEFGSWDSGITAFMQTQYLGTSMSNGVPTGTCKTGFDNLGFVLGTSSNLFSEACVPGFSNTGEEELIDALEGFLDNLFTAEDVDFATYPNPFEAYTVASNVSSQSTLHLVDGGLSNQNNPIWPFIQPARSGVIDVLIVNDNSADTDDNWPNGTEIYNTYLQAQTRGLTRMPTIPPVSTFVSEGLNTHAVVFGCNDPSTLTIIYLPNMEYTYASNTSTAMFDYTPDQTSAMIGNGNAIGTQDGDPDWPECLACAIMHKNVASLPSGCATCLAKYCFTSVSTPPTSTPPTSTPPTSTPPTSTPPTSTPQTSTPQTSTPSSAFISPSIPSSTSNPVSSTSKISSSITTVSITESFTSSSHSSAGSSTSSARSTTGSSPFSTPSTSSFSASVSVSATGYKGPHSNAAFSITATSFVIILPFAVAFVF